MRGELDYLSGVELKSLYKIVSGAFLKRKKKKFGVTPEQFAEVETAYDKYILNGGSPADVNNGAKIANLLREYGAPYPAVSLMVIQGLLIAKPDSEKVQKMLDPRKFAEAKKARKSVARISEGKTPVETPAENPFVNVSRNMALTAGAVALAILVLKFKK